MIEIREARPDEYAEVGELTVRAYAAIGTMPNLGRYGDELRDVAGRAAQPGAAILVAVDGKRLVGDVTYLTDYSLGMEGLPAGILVDSAGFRMLAVDPGAQGLGIGAALTMACVDRARDEGRRAVVLHTTDLMPTAMRLYPRLGFERFEAIDHTIGRRNPVAVHGFRLELDPGR